MLLAVDVGNTNTVLGLFEDHELAHSWRIKTDPRGTADEMALVFRGLLTEVPQITGIALCLDGASWWLPWAEVGARWHRWRRKGAARGEAGLGAGDLAEVGERIAGADWLPVAVR